MIFVFGSNMLGVHGAGAALFAREHKGAQLGVGFGLQGQSFAIPTKDEKVRTLPLHAIHNYILHFLAFARGNSRMDFEVTRIGCGLAGYLDEDVAPLFRGAPPNCWFYYEWKPWLPHIQCNLGRSPK